MLFANQKTKDNLYTEIIFPKEVSLPSGTLRIKLKLLFFSMMCQVDVMMSRVFMMISHVCDDQRMTSCRIVKQIFGFLILTRRTKLSV